MPISGGGVGGRGWISPASSVCPASVPGWGCCCCCCSRRMAAAAALAAGSPAGGSMSTESRDAHYALRRLIKSFLSESYSWPRPRGPAGRPAGRRRAWPSGPSFSLRELRKWAARFNVSPNLNTQNKNATLTPPAPAAPDGCGVQP